VTPLFNGNPLTQGHKILSRKTSPCDSHSEDFVILACSVLIGLKGVMDWRMDDLTMAKTCKALDAVTRKSDVLQIFPILVDFLLLRQRKGLRKSLVVL